jgi:hypothetical protein
MINGDKGNPNATSGAVDRDAAPSLERPSGAEKS